MAQPQLEHIHCADLDDAVALDDDLFYHIPSASRKAARTGGVKGSVGASLEWALSYCEMRLRLATMTHHQKYWRAIERRVRNALDKIEKKAIKEAPEQPMPGQHKGPATDLTSSERLHSTESD
jgi:hypothetical protein